MLRNIYGYKVTCQRLKNCEMSKKKKKREREREARPSKAPFAHRRQSVGTSKPSQRHISGFFPACSPRHRRLCARCSLAPHAFAQFSRRVCLFEPGISRPQPFASAEETPRNGGPVASAVLYPCWTLRREPAVGLPRGLSYPTQGLGAAAILFFSLSCLVPFPLGPASAKHTLCCQWLKSKSPGSGN